MIDLIVPGHGSPMRSPNLVRSINLLQANVKKIDCTIYVYNRLQLSNISNCKVIHNSGKWTNFMKKFKSKKDFVVLLMDDAILKHVNILSMLKKMKKYKLDVITPSIHKWHHPIMKPKYVRHLKENNVLGETPIFSRRLCATGLRHSVYIDMLFVIFTQRAWRCWQRKIDNINTDGWGYDLLFWRNCRMRMAIDDTQYIEHPKDPQTTYSHFYAHQNMFQYLCKNLNMNLTQVKRYRLDMLRTSTQCIK